MAEYTKEITIGEGENAVKMGNDNPIVIQSMTNTYTDDVDSTVKQIQELDNLGCEMVRVTVPDLATVDVLPEIKDRIEIPLVGDIHNDPRIALRAADKKYLDKLRLNPGNIEKEKDIKEIAEKAGKEGIPIRVGANSGSIKKEYRDLPRDEGLVESALEEVNSLEDYGLEDIVVSVKSSNVGEMVNAYRKISNEIDYPLHLGVTEAGSVYSGSIKNAMGMGILLDEGIGDTIRVSLSGDPKHEIRAAKEILRNLDLYDMAEVIGCPTCGRTTYNLAEIVERTEGKVYKNSDKLPRDFKVAVMGCTVNGEQEAGHADLGIFGTKNRESDIFVIKSNDKGDYSFEIEAEDEEEKTEEIWEEWEPVIEEFYER
ncbi:MAG: flavodoxin-dependent (E)-4-hydroxy-3-methylbut-2-enyl-diphosphate synthase [Candidatus Aenigmatarchaeota archaeon]